MTIKMTLTFSDYDSAKNFAGSLDAVSDYFSWNDGDQDYSLSEPWEETLISIHGTDIADVSPSEIRNYFHNGSTGSFEWINQPDGTTKTIRHGVLNNRYLSERQKEK